MGMIKRSQSSQNSEFPMSFQYLKIEVRDGVEFLHADKHQSFLQGDFNTLNIKVSYKIILSWCNGDKLSPWNMLLFLVTIPNFCPLSISSVFHFSMLLTSTFSTFSPTSNIIIHLFNQRLGIISYAS